MVRVVADLHVHSRYAMACSASINIRSMEATALQKGINLLGTGDFTHPGWLSELKSELESCDNGTYKVKGSASNVRFVLSTEIATTHSVGDYSKRIHHCVMLPGFDVVDSFINEVKSKGNLSADGRPMLSMSPSELVDAAMSADSKAFVYPAHMWTPFFGALGQYANFSSLKEVYEDREKDIYAGETGLSSDPKMNWRVSNMDRYTLLSSSDMHSLAKMGREANVFDLNDGFSYSDLINAIKDKDGNHFSKTIEFYPEEGKYHYDGHRDCRFSINPEIEKSRICPVCGKPLVIGVLHRVNDLADNPPGRKPAGAHPFINLVPLAEIIAYVMKKADYSTAVKAKYEELIGRFGTEFEVLSEAKIDDIGAVAGDEIAEAVSNVRENRIRIEPGYNGVFGRLYLLGEDAKENNQTKSRQKSLFDR